MPGTHGSTVDAAAPLTRAAWEGCPPLCPCGHRDDVTFTLAPDPVSAKIARDIAVTTLNAWRLTGPSDEVTLVLSELVTNALRHGAPTTPGPWVIRVRLAHRNSSILCAVADPGPHPPVLAEPADIIETGRGLHLVAGCSRRWGWLRCRAGYGKLVWALFAPPDPHHGATTGEEGLPKPPHNRE